MKDLRLELRTKNNVLWHVIFDAYASVAHFARACDVHPSVIGNFLNLKSSPYITSTRGKHKGRQISIAAEKIVAFTNLSISELFPPHLYENALPSLRVAEVDGVALLRLSELSREDRCLPPRQEDEIFEGERHDVLEAVLSELPKRQRELLKARFGLHPYDHAHTLKELSEKHQVTSQRIYQLEAIALRRMRHPGRMKRLMALVNGVE